MSGTSIPLEADSKPTSVFAGVGNEDNAGKRMWVHDYCASLASFIIIYVFERLNVYINWKRQCSSVPETVMSRPIHCMF